MRPQIVAHRGASREVAEHTLAAYVEALSVGADAVECDVRLTADGHLVCVHDRDLRRTASRKGIVSTMELADLSELDFASWKNPWAELDDEGPDRESDLDGVLTLRKLLETVSDYDRRIELAIETKHPTRYAGLVERRVVEMLRDFGWDRAGTPVRVMSFSYVALQRVEKMAPDLPKVILIDKPRAWQLLKGALEPGWMLGPGIELLEEHPRLAEKLRATGRDLHVWTVNTEAQLRLCLDLGVRAVITDRPAYMLELIEA